MPRYRNLSLDELESLEKEFIEFLVLNGITGEDWKKIKNQDLQKASKIIEAFSDVVFEKIMRKTEYLVLYERHNIATFQCLSNKVVMVGIECPINPEIDFRIHDVFAFMSSNPNAKMKVFTKDKVYTEVREIEIYKMIKRGASISDGVLFKKFCLLLQ